LGQPYTFATYTKPFYFSVEAGDVYFIVLRRRKGKNTDEANWMCIRNTLDESYILSGAGIWVSLNILHEVLADWGFP